MVLSFLQKLESRAIVDSIAIFFPLFSSAQGKRTTAHNGVTFWRVDRGNYWYTTTELSRYMADGVYYAPLHGAKPYAQNNVHAPTARSIRAAIDRIYSGYVDVIFPGDLDTFRELLNSSQYYDYWPKLCRIDVAFDVSANIVPTPANLLSYVTHGRGCSARNLRVAAKQGLYFYDKRACVWWLRRTQPDGSEHYIKTQPYFMRSASRLRAAIREHEITVYCGTKNAEIKIYGKGKYIRYELSARKSILRQLLHDRRPDVLNVPSVLSRLFFAVGRRISELFRRSCCYGRFRRAVRLAVANLMRNFASVSYYSKTIRHKWCMVSLYNHVFPFFLRPLPQKERPPPFLP